MADGTILNTFNPCHGTLHNSYYTGFHVRATAEAKRLTQTVTCYSNFSCMSVYAMRSSRSLWLLHRVNSL